jgi:hypothetical protein
VGNATAMTVTSNVTINELKQHTTNVTLARDRTDWPLFSTPVRTSPACDSTEKKSKADLRRIS